MCWLLTQVVRATNPLGLQGHPSIQSRTSRSEKENDLPRSRNKVVEGLYLPAGHPLLPSVRTGSQKKKIKSFNNASSLYSRREDYFLAWWGILPITIIIAIYWVVAKCLALYKYFLHSL